MTHQPRSYLLSLGLTRAREPVPLELDDRGVGLLLAGERLPVLAVARSLMVQLASQSVAPVLLRADDRITVGGVPVVALGSEAAGAARRRTATFRALLSTTFPGLCCTLIRPCGCAVSCSRAPSSRRDWRKPGCAAAGLGVGMPGQTKTEVFSRHQH